MNTGKNNYGKTIGGGGFGKVLVVDSAKFKKKVAIKQVAEGDIYKMAFQGKGNATLLGEHKRNEFLLRKEKDLMMQLKAKNLDCCVEYLDCEENPFRIIMEYCEGGDLRKIFDEKNTEVVIDIVDKVEMIHQIITAIKRIHEAKFIHGDLKCRNIFLANKYIPGIRNHNITIKIGDFGISEKEGKLIYGGTKYFQAPETKENGQGGSFESDIYSLGKVMLEIMTELPEYKISLFDINNFEKIKHKLPKLLNVSAFYNVIKPCLAIDPKDRPTASELLELFERLVNLWIEGEKMNEKILGDNKLGDKIAVDTHLHILVLANDQMRQYSGEGWICNTCREKGKIYHYLHSALSFHCHRCEYDLCLDCFKEHNYKYVNNKMIEKVPQGKKVYVTTHPDYLTLSGKEEKNSDFNWWTCALCNKEVSDFVYSFSCKKCGYDICLECYEKHIDNRKKDDCGCNII